MQMAGISSPEGIERLEDQITCPVCLEHFTKPKILPCFHSFCLHCIEGIPKESVDGRDCASCPVCRSSCPVPDKGLATLPSSFVINNLMEVHDLMKKVTGDQDNAAYCDNCEKTNADRYCKQCVKFFCPQCLKVHDKWKPNSGHQTINLQEVASTVFPLDNKPEETVNCIDHNTPQEIFCKTCCEPICQICAINKHKDHNFDIKEDLVLYNNLCSTINSTLEPLSQEIDRLTQAKTTLVNRRTKITQQAETAHHGIDQTISQLKDQLDKTGRKLKEDVDWVLAHKIDVLENQIKEADVISSQAMECKNLAEGYMEGDSVMNRTTQEMEQAIQQAKDVTNRIKELAFIPLEEADIELATNSANSSDVGNNIGKLHYSLLVSKIKVTVEKLHVLPVGQESSITISFSHHDDSLAPVPPTLVNCYLTPPLNHGQTVDCSVIESLQSGQYDVTFIPITRGRYQLHVMIRDDIISGCPINVIVGDFFATLYGPSDIAMNEDGQLLVVSESDSHHVTILDYEGNKIRSFGSKGSGRGQFNCPQGVAITSNETILVADTKNNRIQEFTMEGECISCVGGKGDSPVTFYHPHGIASDKTTGQVFVVDKGNHRVQILNSDLTFRRAIGSNGIKPGQFRYPYDVTICREYFYVTEKNNNRIQKFTLEGQIVSLFDGKELQLRFPSGIASNNKDILYVKNSGNNLISVMTTEGEHLRLIEKKAQSHVSLQGLLYNSTQGYLYVCHEYNIEIFFV